MPIQPGAGFWLNGREKREIELGTDQIVTCHYRMILVGSR